MKSLLFSFSILFTFSIAACKKDDTPAPVEQELITTIRLIITDTAGAAQSFDYRVENGFGSTSPGSAQVDSIILPASLSGTYNVEVRVLNESVQPADDATDEIIAERNAHLFLFNTPAQPAVGPVLLNGSLDGNGLPFNQTIRMEAPNATTGLLTVTLLHEPTDKNAATPAAAGGETDAEAVFPYRIMP